MDKNSTIYVAGHTGLVGSAICKELAIRNYTNIVTCKHEALDLRNQENVDNFFCANDIEYVFLAAAHVGGIEANRSIPAKFIYDNLMIQTNVIDCAHKYHVKKLLFLGSSCIYPKYCPQPMREEHLLSANLEPTNEAYAIAKIAGIKMCQAYNQQYKTNFIAVMPTNLYGPNDNYDLETSHVLPAMIRKFHEAKINKQKEVVLWGTGSPTREFLFSEDCANACVSLMDNYDSSEIINIGYGSEVTIREIATIIKTVIGFEGEIVWDHIKPNGTPKKLLDSSKLFNLGWKPKTHLINGIEKTYKDYVEGLK